jgi:hypothetical protein
MISLLFICGLSGVFIASAYPTFGLGIVIVCGCAMVITAPTGKSV